MEGADPIQDPADLKEWYRLGLRAIGPAWHSTRYSFGTGEPGPLTELGRKLLSAMADLNMLLDLSHMAEAAFLEAVDSYSGSLIASHSNPRIFLPTDRGLSDGMIRKLVGRDGVVGVALYNRYLKPGWQVGDSRQSVTLETVGEVVDKICQLAGDARHAGIGSDFDGGFGREAIPAGMDTCADLQNLTPILAKRGYTRSDIEAIFYRNWLRILERVLPEKSVS
jgi:membrane dipeptidase